MFNYITQSMKYLILTWLIEYRSYIGAADLRLDGPKIWKFHISLHNFCVKIVSLPKNLEKQLVRLTPPLQDCLFFGKLIILTQTLRTGKFIFSKFFGHPVSYQLPQYRTSALGFLSAKLNWKTHNMYNDKNIPL